jgi:hypothetical protein
MPVGLIKAPQRPFGLPLSAGAGMNDQLLLEVTNNSGTFLRPGDVVCWDTNTTLTAVTPVLVNANFTLTTTTQTITANASTASYAAQGVVLIPITVTGTAGQNTVPAFVAYGGIAGSTFTTAFSNIASVTNGAQANASIFQWPPSAANPYSATAGVGNTNVAYVPPPNYVQPIAAQLTAPADGGRLVTLSTTAAFNNPLVAGVVSVDGTAATTNGELQNVAFPGGAIPPGGNCMIAVAGVARVNIAANTVAALSLLGADKTPGAAESATAGTLGNLLGIALEAQTAKDANNTIRAALKIG